MPNKVVAICFDGTGLAGRGTGEERQTALFRGMEESQADQFDRDWHQHVRQLHRAKKTMTTGRLSESDDEI